MRHILLTLAGMAFLSTPMVCATEVSIELPPETATFKATDQLTLRAGVAYDQSPVNEEYRTPRIPDGDRYWLSLGAGWRPTDWFDLDAAFTYIDVESTNVRLTSADTGSTFRGNLDAEYDSYIVLLGLSARLRF